MSQKFPRSSGILLHPTSLPTRFGIGDFGPAAYYFADFLARAGQSLWQVLPLGPTGYGDSPYQTFSAFAGNPLLISLELLVEEGLLPPTALDHAPPFPAAQVDYGLVIDYKKQLLEQAFVYFEEVAARQPAALAGQRQRLEREIRRHIFVQYLFFRQWTALKAYVSRRGIRII